MDPFQHISLLAYFFFSFRFGVRCIYFYFLYFVFYETAIPPPGSCLLVKPLVLLPPPRRCCYATSVTTPYRQRFASLIIRREKELTFPFFLSGFFFLLLPFGKRAPFFLSTFSTRYEKKSV